MIDQLLKIAARVAASFTRHGCPNAEDMQQEALVAMLNAMRTYDPERGQTDPYFSRVAALAIREYIAREACPVTIPQHRAEVGLTVTRAAQLPDMTDDRQLPDQALHDKRVRAFVRELLDNPLAEAVLLDEWSPREVAAARAVPRSKVYGAVKRGKKRLRELWVAA